MSEFRSDLSEKDYMDFLQTQTHYHVLQTAMWARVKDNWDHTFCALYRDGKCVAAAMLLIRTLPFGQKLIYSPRGFTLDYTDSRTLEEFTQHVVLLAKKMGAYLIRIDPEILLSERQEETIHTLPNGAEQIRALEHIGFRHMGFDKGFGIYTQPRYHSEFPLRGQDGQPRSDEEILAGFERRIRKQIGKYTQDRGVFFTKDTSDEAIKLFARIEDRTARRHQISLRNEDYFRKIKKAFGDDCTCFLAYLDADRFEAFNRKQIEIREEKKIFQNDLEKIRRLRMEMGSTIPLAAVLSVQTNDTAYILYGGFDDSLFPRLSVNYQLRYEVIRTYRDEGLKTVSFMGIHGDLNDSLSAFKLKFHPIIREYAGEFEYPIRKIQYHVMKKLLPWGRSLYLKLHREKAS